MKFYNVLISGLLSFSVLTSSSMTAVAVENKSHNENSYPMAMTSSEISDFLEEAVPAPIPESKIKDVNLFTKERTGSYTYDLDTKELEYSSFTASDFTCDTQSSQVYIPDELMSQSGLIENGDQINGIVGSDDRVKVGNTAVGPWCNTVKLLIKGADNKSYMGSGFMIGPNSVATAGHCVYNTDWNGWAKSITVIPALNGTTQPYGSATSYNLECGGDWYNSNYNQDDWGVIRINANLGNSTGWLGLRWQSSSYNGSTVKAVGYPSTDKTHMYYGSGKVKSSSARTLSGDWDLSGGQSGGPVHIYYSSTGYTAVGINRGGGSTYSDCLRIDEWIYNKLMSYRTLTY